MWFVVSVGCSGVTGHGGKTGWIGVGCDRRCVVKVGES